MDLPSSSEPPFSRGRPPKRILVVRLGAVGDLVRTLPAVRLLRRTWPEATLGWAVETHVAPLLHGQPDIDRLFVYDRDQVLADARRMRPHAVAQVARFGRELREFGPDLAIDFQGCFKSGLAAWLSRAPVRIGFDKDFVRERSHLFSNVRVPLPPAETHRVLRALALARAAGAEGGQPPANLALTTEEAAHGRGVVEGLSFGGEVVAIAPFSSGRQAWKRYPAERWGEVARRLSREGCTVLVLAGPGEMEEARQLSRVAGKRVVPCDGGGLRALAGILAACDLLIGGDTGPMHMAWGVGTPVVAIYGPTDRDLNAPYGPGHCTLAPERRTGRQDADKFPGITPERIVEAAMGLLRPREVVAPARPSSVLR